MKLLPRTLLGRTALLFALLIILSQVAWFGIVRLLFIPPLRAAHTNPIVSTIVMARTALASLPPEQRQPFLDALGEGGSLRIVPDSSPQAAFPTASENLPRDLLLNLRQTLGNAVIVKSQPGTHDLWIRFPAGGQDYWLVAPRGRFHTPFPLDLLVWVALGVVIATLGAWLVLFRLNRQLHRVLEAARDLGRGKTPPQLPETGPEEIRDLSRGFNQMADALQKLDAARRLMLAGISHDLRTPLTRLRIGIELLNDKVEPALSHGMIHDIEDMDSILMQFLDYARDGSEEAPQFADFNQIVFDVCHRYRVAGSHIQTDLDALPGFVFRKLAVRRLISNLVDNAVRHGGDKIEVHTHERHGDVVLEVMDRGPGLRRMDPGEVIKPFVREDSARGRHMGAGLGLAIADRIVKMHRGRLSIGNRDGGGVQVAVEIPLLHQLDAPPVSLPTMPATQLPHS